MGHRQPSRRCCWKASSAPTTESRRGALAYVEGREKEALEIFEGINPRSLLVTLGGQIALVKSALLVNSDLRGAMIQLDDARLLTTGTLVEEAALRRQIFVAGQVDDFNKFEMLAIQCICAATGTRSMPEIFANASRWKLDPVQLRAGCAALPAPGQHAGVSRREKSAQPLPVGSPAPR